MKSGEVTTDSLDCTNFRDCDGPIPHYETSDEFDNGQRDADTWWPVSHAEDNISNRLSGLDLALKGISLGKDRSSQDRRDTQSVQGEHSYFQVAIPTFSNGLTTFAYQHALRWRISHDKLLRHAQYDTRKYTPTFIHDCLMLPGSLANVLGKVSASDISHRMTPALLPGFRRQLDCETQQACVIQSTDPADYVQGMLILGQGKAGRDRIHEHYRPHGRRAKVNVEIDVTISIPHFSRDYVYERWRLQRRKVKAHVWLRSKVCSIHTLSCPDMPLWNFEDYLEGTYDNDDNALLIDPSTYGLEEDGGVCLPDLYYDEADEPQTALRGGCGHLDYVRVEDGWTGW